MSEYYFAVYTGQGKRATLPGGKRTANRMHRIAQKIDHTAGYTYYYDEARDQWRGWAYCRNYGAPFDQATAKAIQEAWNAAGITL